MPIVFGASSLSLYIGCRRMRIAMKLGLDAINGALGVAYGQGFISPVNLPLGANLIGNVYLWGI